MALVTAATPTRQQRQGGPFRRNGRKQPLVITGGEPGAWTEAPYFRASSVGKLLEDATGIGIWESNNLMWAAGHDESLRLSLAAVDDANTEDGKQRMRDLRERGAHVSGMTEKRERGTDLHALFNRIDRGEVLPPTIDVRFSHLLAEYPRVLSHFVVSHQEHPVVCDELGIAGTLDKLVSPRGVMVPRDRKGNQIAPEVTPDDVVVADVKTSGSTEYFGAGFAGQMAPYACSVGYREEEDPAIREQQLNDGVDLYSPAARLARVKAVHRTPHGARTDVALLIHAPSDGAAVDLYWFDIRRGFEAARHAMGTRAWRSQGRSLWAPAELPHVEPVNAAGQTLGESYDQGQREADAADRLGPRLQAAHASRQLLDAIGRVTSDADARALWARDQGPGGAKVWTHEHTTKVGEVLGVPV